MATKSKNLNTETEMVGTATVFTELCPKLTEALISLVVTFSSNLMQMIKSTAQKLKPEN